MAKNIFSEQITGTDQKNIVSFLFVVFGLFSITAFIKIDLLWGINFLYYLPLWTKVLYIGTGGLVFLAPFNKLLFRLITFASQLLCSITERHRPWYLRTAILLILIILFGGLLYLFRVVSLYHDATQAIYFIRRDIPIAEYYEQIANMRNKPILLLYISFIRFFFRDLLGFDSYWSLVVSSIVLGVILLSRLYLS